MRKILIRELAELALIFEKPMTQEIISAYESYLKDLSDEEIIAACRTYAKSSNAFFPKPGQLIALCKSEADPEFEAAHLADVIFNALRLYGADKVGEQRAKERIGDVGWKWVTDQGGWSRFISSVTDEEQVPILKAQCRKSLVYVISQAHENRNTTSVNEIEIRKPEQVERKIDFSFEACVMATDKPNHSRNGCAAE